MLSKTDLRKQNKINNKKEKNMIITIDRAWKKADYTISRLYIDGELFCNALEDTDRGLYQGMAKELVMAQKVKGATAIPRGTYNVIYTYSPRFKRKLPLIENVTGYEGVRFHPGNTAKDTEGCILCGVNKKKGMVLDSRVWTENVIAKMQESWNRKERVTLKIK